MYSVVELSFCEGGGWMKEIKVREYDW
jgi:hypothetical protein